MAADKYWLKRLKRDRGLSRRAASAVEAEVKRAYRGQYLQVARRLDELYAEAQARGELSRTKLWNYRTYRSLERQLREFCEAEVLTQREALTKCLDRVFNDVIGADIRTFQQDKFIVRYNPRAVIDTAWSGESYSSRIWKNNEALASRIQSECQQIVMGMKGPETIKRDLMKDFDVSYRQASRLIDTEVSYVLNKANLEQYRAYGFEKITIVNLDVNTCDKCKALEDEVFYIFDAPVLPLHPHCHCSYCVPEELDEAEVTASRANLEAVYERKGVAQGGKGRTYTPKGAPASANPSALARKIEAVTAAKPEAVTAAKPEAAKAAKAEKAAEPTPEPKTNPQTSADVQAPKLLPAPEAQAAKSPENTGVLGAEVLPKQAESGIIETYKERLEHRTIIKNSEVNNGLPISSTPDSITDLVDDDGKVLKRRIYGEDGRAAVDFDTGDHRRPDIHTTGAHKHTFDYTRKNSRGKNLVLTDDELLMNSDIIKEGVNYFADRRNH